LLPKALTNQGYAVSVSLGITSIICVARFILFEEPYTDKNPDPGAGLAVPAHLPTIIRVLLRRRRASVRGSLNHRYCSVLSFGDDMITFIL
jgi:hypothetical protein